jgi:serine/threonine-protein kinase
MGVVYRARHAELGRLVALKMTAAGAIAETSDLARLRQEAQAIAQLQHPNIVQLFEVGEQEGLPYLALEYVPGGNLHDALGGKSCDGRTAARILETLARAIAHAHRRGIVHRDLKPSNILLDSRMSIEDAEPKITDFGLARDLRDDRQITQSGHALGTPCYVPPEQAVARPGWSTPLVDVYALGAILYEMLVGHPPFVGEPLDVMGRTMGEVPQAPNRVLEKEHETRHGLNSMTTRRLLRIPPALEDLCMRCLSKERADRPGKMSEVADLLEGMLKGKRRRP